MRSAIRSIGRMLGYTIRRSGSENRFNATSSLLHHLHRSGYRPNAIIDGGANLGQWAGDARAAFPEAHLHLVEPQPQCRAALDAFVQRDRNATLHPFALGATDNKSVPMSGAGSTGAWIPVGAQRPDADAQQVTTMTLDTLFASSLKSAGSTLLKLDLEGYEMQALSGAALLIEKVDVAYIEVSFYHGDDPERPVFDDIHRWFTARDFTLYDIASLGSRASDGRLRSGDVVYVRNSSPLIV